MKKNSSKISCGWDVLSKKEGLDLIYKWKLSPVLNASFVMEAPLLHFTDSDFHMSEGAHR